MKRHLMTDLPARRERGAPDLADEAATLRWIARQASTTVAEVRAARATRERRGLPSTGNADLDAVRRHVEAALNGRRPGPLPFTGRRSTGTTRTRSASTTAAAPSDAARRAVSYSTTWRTR